MKLKLILLQFVMLISVLSFAQENKRNQKDIVEDQRIYFYLEENTKEIKYFLKKIGNDGALKISNDDLFSLKMNTECNIFFKWLNPLVYRVAFKDTVYVSPSDAVINDYVKSYLSAIGGVDAAANTSTKSLDGTLLNFAAANATGRTGFDLINEKTAFKTKDLNLLFIQLLNSEFDPEDAQALNELIGELHTLEDFHVNNFAELVSVDVDKLKKVTDYTKVLNETNAISTTITNNYEKTIKDNEDAQKDLEGLQFVITNKPIEAYTKIVLKDFLAEVKAKLLVDKELIQKLKEINNVMIQSVSVEKSKDFDGYFQIKSIEFKDNQNFETSFIVSKYEIDNKRYEVIKKEDIVTRKIIFEKYDPVKVNISTGIFYANYTLKGFGVSQGSDKLTVTEDDIQSNTAIPATFLNFLFDIGSRTFLPILQFGADPTKKRPFMLLGGGFAIPSSRFAITGGPIWTWDAELDTLTLGQEVDSTTDLEKDIKYTFDVKPKGFYVGLQYNF